MRQSTVLVLTVSLFFVSVPNVTEAPSEPRLLSVFPDDNTEIFPDSKIIVQFSDLMDALSVLEAINVTLDVGLDVPVSINGECGDGTTLIFGPESGPWEIGNYTLRFTAEVLTAAGQVVNTALQEVRFKVVETAQVIYSAIATDLSKAISSFRSGEWLSLFPGSIELSFSFSIEIDVGKLFRALQGAGGPAAQAKVTECNARAVSLSLSLSIGVPISFALFPDDISDRWNETRRIADPISVMIRSVTGAVSGVVTNLAGIPLPSTEIELRNQLGLVANTSADESGRYYVGMLLPGTYEVCVNAAGFSSSCQAVLVTSDVIATRNFHLTATHPPNTGLAGWIIVGGAAIVILSAGAVALLLRRRRRPLP